jgi:hypothetical protein
MPDFDPERPVDANKPQVDDDVPEGDALEQQADALPDNGDEEAPIDPELEADFADVEEQRRTVPLPDDDRDNS